MKNRVVAIALAAAAVATFIPAPAGAQSAAPAGAQGTPPAPPRAQGAPPPAGARGGGRGGAAANRPPTPIRRLPDGKPDLSGMYNSDAGGANYGLERHDQDFLTPAGRGVVVDPPDGQLPMQPWAQAEFDSRNRPERGYDDPTAHCFVAGVPRSMYVPSPLHILQPPGYVVILHERMSYRVIPLDRKHTLPDHVRLWQGDSVGRWEGDTLVVESKNFNGKTWLNEVGEITSHALTVVERFTPIDGDTIEYRATLTDPLVYTRPFTISFPVRRSAPGDELLEVACLEDDVDLPHLKDVRDEFRKKQKEGVK